MKSNAIIGIIVVAVIVLGAGYYFYSHKNGTTGGVAQQQTTDAATVGTTKTTGTPDTVNTAGTPGKFSGSMSTLAARGGEWKCTVDSSSDQSVSSGIVYVSGGKVSASFTSTVKGFGDIMSYMISDGSYVYTWSTAMPTGIKIPVAKKGTTAGPALGQGMIDDTHSYTYVCEKWSVNPTVFVPPNTVTFKALNS